MTESDFKLDKMAELQKKISIAKTPEELDAIQKEMDNLFKPTPYEKTLFDDDCDGDEIFKFSQPKTPTCNRKIFEINSINQQMVFKDKNGVRLEIEKVSATNIWSKKPRIYIQYARIKNKFEIQYYDEELSVFLSKIEEITEMVDTQVGEKQTI